MRLLTAILAAMLMLAAPACAHASSEVPETVETSVGELVLLKLPGNPRAGYKWQLNVEQSTGLHLVAVDPVGWIMAPEARSIYFSNYSILNVAIIGKAPGEANLAFEYMRNYGRYLSVRTSTVKVIVKPAGKAR